MKLVKEVYIMTAEFPKYEQFGLVNQLRRAVVSIPSNIAEGAGKNSDIDFSRFVSIASGSCNEVETQLLLSLELGFITEEQFKVIDMKTQRVQNMLFGLHRSLRNT